MDYPLYVRDGYWQLGFDTGTIQQSYLDLITSQYQSAPKFMAVIQALTSGLVDAQEVMGHLSVLFDLDAAVGDQLDRIGEWVGLSRYLQTPLTGVYFSWDSTAALGWEGGSWQGAFDPTSGLSRLPDDAYRQYLRAKIAANSWDGTIPGAYAVLAVAFGAGNNIIIQDGQNMTMSVAFAGNNLGAALISLLTTGLPLKPSGVRIAEYFVPVDSGKMFAWDSSGPYLAGWDVPGKWATEIFPPTDNQTALFAWDTATAALSGWGSGSWLAGN